LLINKFQVDLTLAYTFLADHIASLAFARESSIQFRLSRVKLEACRTGSDLAEFSEIWNRATNECLYIIGCGGKSIFPCDFSREKT
jgi:hypothetical protein